MTITFLFYLLMVKHAVCDFYLQGRLTGIGDENKLLSKKKNRHALDHAIGTAVVFIILNFLTQASWLVIPLFAVMDYVLHLLIDWRKNIITKHYGLKAEDRSYWKLTAIDQCAHYSCYFLYCWLYIVYWL